METKKPSNFFLGIIALVIFSALIKDLNFKELTLKRPALDAVYAITLGFLGFAVLRKKKTQPENENESSK